MRFQQLKRDPNNILKKKLIKSGKSWVVVASLSIAGGLFLSSPAVVKADEVSDSTPTTQVQSDVSQQKTITQDSNNNSDKPDVNKDVQDKSTDTNVSTENQASNISSDESTDDENTVNSGPSSTTGKVSETQIQTTPNTVPTEQSKIDTVPTEQAQTEQPIQESEPDKTFVPDGIDESTIIDSGTDRDGLLYSVVKDPASKDVTLYLDAGILKTGTIQSLYQQIYANTKSHFTMIDSSKASGDIILPPDSSSLFSGLNKLKSINFQRNIDTSQVTNMSSMFRNNKSLASLDLSGFKTSNVTDMSNMFQDTLLASLDLSGFNTSKVTSMSGMFVNDHNITSLNLSSFDTSQVIDMSNMFNAADELTSIAGLSKFNTSKVTDMKYMFANTFALTDIDLSNFNTSNVTDMSYMFVSTHNLAKIDLSNFNTSNVENMDGMFSHSGISVLDLRNFDVSKVTTMDEMFYGTNNLKLLNIQGWQPTLADTSTLLVNVGDSENPIDNIDISGFTFNPNQSSNIFKDSNLKSITVSSNAAVINSMIPLSKYASHWVNIGNGTMDNPKGDLTFNTLDEQKKVFSSLKGIETFVQVYPTVTLKQNIYTGDNNEIDSLRDILNKYPEDDSNPDDINIINATLKKLKDATELYDSVSYSLKMDSQTHEFIENQDSNIKLPDSPKNKLIMTISTSESYNNPIYIVSNQSAIAGTFGESPSISLIYTILKEKLNDYRGDIYTLNLYYPTPAAITVDVQDPIDSSKKTSITVPNIKPGEGPVTLTGIPEVNGYVTPVLTATYTADGIVVTDQNKKIIDVDHPATYSLKPNSNNNHNNHNSDNSNPDDSQNVISKENIQKYIATYPDQGNVPIYQLLTDNSMTPCKNRELAHTTNWLTDRKVTIGKDIYYRVATNEYVKATRVYPYEYTNVKIRTNSDSNKRLYTAEGNLVGNRQLAANSNWKTDRIAIINNVKYYRVSTNEFVRTDDVYVY